MDKSLVKTITSKLTTGVSVLVTALEMDNILLAEEAINSAEQELALLRQMVEEQKKP